MKEHKIWSMTMAQMGAKKLAELGIEGVNEESLMMSWRVGQVVSRSTSAPPPTFWASCSLTATASKSSNRRNYARR